MGKAGKPPPGRLSTAAADLGWAGQSPETLPAWRKGPPMAYKAEYIWVDGTKPTAKLRSKTKIVEDGVKPADLPIWGFDGSSTNQAPGDASDCVLQPVFTCPDPIRGGDNLLVPCQVLYIDITPHATNQLGRAAGRGSVWPA